MTDKINTQWKNESGFDNWELRDYRFSPEMLNVIMGYLHINFPMPMAQITPASGSPPIRLAFNQA